jgi:four helix bundle protein
MSYVSHFRELHVFERGMELVQAVYPVSAHFPKADLYGLAGQIRRAAISIPANIAEGHMRASTKEYVNHVSIVPASLAALGTQLEIAMFELVASEETKPILDQAVVLGQLWALRKAGGRQ